MIRQRAIPDTTLEDGLDRQNLTLLRKRFLSINTDRLERMRSALNSHQQLCLDALPLLFHTNHPMMPGFVSRSTPARLCNFKPDKDILQLGRRVARSFTLGYDPSVEEDIYGIYVMGSVGTIAQSESSDLDIWLCHKPGLSKQAVDELEQKCTKISEWAMSLRLEMHFFTMDYEEFKRGTLSALNEESSGSAQRLLLLDEFYRSAIFLGGRIPLWWFVPARAEKDYENYSSTLLDKRFLSDNLVLDFGGIATIPDGEFIGAGIWQLYKAIESPYKSVLKLLLLEAYVSEHPNIDPLSLSFKREVFAGEVDINNLDSYLIIYRRIERYLQQKQQYKRLELARRCFYFKVNKPLSRPSRSNTKSWQRVLMEQLVKDWEWSEADIALLDKRKRWKTNTVAMERSQLVSELNHSYRFLLDFANNCGVAHAISSDELNILGRKLQAAFERRPGKIDWINPGISHDLSEPLIALHSEYEEALKTTLWTAVTFDEDSPNAGGEAIKASPSVVELMLWCYYNGLIDNSTRFDLTGCEEINEYELRRLLNLFQQWLPQTTSSLPHETFKQSAVPSDAMLLINVAKHPMSQLQDHGYQRLSSRSDALRYSGFDENLVVSVDIVIRNSWNEINTRRFEKDTALLDALHEYLQLCLPGTHHLPPALTVECVGETLSNTISQRVKDWFNEIVHCFYADKKAANRRYIFEMGNHYYCLQFSGMKLVTRAFTNPNALLAHLGEEQTKPSPIVLDSNALHLHPLRPICSHTKAQSVSVFYHRFDIGMEIFVVDEKGSIHYTLLRGCKDHNPLKSLHRFLRATINREARSNPAFSGDFGIFPIHFYELSKNITNQYGCVSKRISTELPSPALFDVKAIAHPVNDNVVFDFYCDDQEFSAVSFGEQLELVVAQFILSRRADNNRYPIYITDIDLSLCAGKISENGELQINHYLTIKSDLEFKLNQAIGILLKA